MTNFNDAQWGTIGKIPADSDFFAGGLDISDIMDGQGFTMEFSKVLGEQVFKLTEPSEHPFTARLTGKPIRVGAGWLERLCKRMGAGAMPTTDSGGNIVPAKSGAFKRGGTNGTVKEIDADDDLRYYDSEGKEFAYQSENVKGWIPLTLPSNLDIYDMFSQEGGLGELNGILVDNVKQGYDNILEAEIQKHAINLCPYVENVGYISGKDLFTKIRDYVSKMRSDDYAFNQYAIAGSSFATDDAYFNDNYEHKAKDVVIFMNRMVYNAMMDDFATYPSPEYIKEVGAEFVLMDNSMVTPYADASAMATDGFTDYGGMTAATDMPMLGEDAPQILIMDRRFCEYRPIIDSYRINISKNGAGDFTNEHMHFKGGLNVKPWASCVALNEITIGEEPATEEGGSSEGGASEGGSGGA